MELKKLCAWGSCSCGHGSCEIQLQREYCQRGIQTQRKCGECEARMQRECGECEIRILSYALVGPCGPDPQLFFPDTSVGPCGPDLQPFFSMRPSVLAGQTRTIFFLDVSVGLIHKSGNPMYSKLSH